MHLFDAGKRFYKGNFHMHTTLSDGVLTPEQACAIYRANGYDFVAITDHRRMGRQRNLDGLLVLSGGEYDFSFPTQQLHLLAIMPDDALAGTKISREDPNAFIEHILGYRGVVLLAHPAWSLNTVEFMKTLGPLAAAEVFNSVSDAPWNGARADSSHVLDLLCTNGRILPQIATDDSHWYNGEHCRAYTMVQAECLAPEPILEALQSRHFYASQGPEFYSAEVLEDRMIVETSPVEQILFNSNLTHVRNRCRIGHGMTHDEYVFNRTAGERFVRCEITDAQGRRAWLSPLPL